jgi:hypothetical protein
MENVDKYIKDLPKFEFNNPNDNGIPNFKSNNAKGNQIQGFIDTAIQPLEEEKAKIKTIRETLSNNDKSSFVNSNTKTQYIKYLTYLEDLIEAKITKDKSIMGLLALSFNGINISIQTIEGIKKELTGKELKELIPLYDKNFPDKDKEFPPNNEEYKLTLDQNTAKALGKDYQTNQKLTIGEIKTAINGMIVTCQDNIRKYIREFQQNLRRTEPKNISQTDIVGGDYKNLGYGENNDSATKIDEYKENLKNIKDKYEQALKDDIKAYKELCDLLTEKNGGLLDNINISVQSLRKNSNKLSKKMGLNVDGLLDPDPFNKNKELFDILRNMVEEEKRGLLLNDPPEFVEKKPVGEKRIEGSQPLKESFERFLNNLQLVEDNNANLEPYRISLLYSLGNINDALDQSFKSNVFPVQIDTGYPHNYIAYDFGWKDNNSSRIEAGGEWRDNGITYEGTSPTDEISNYITILKNDTITKQKLEIILRSMIELLQFEESTAEKSATAQGVNTSDFRETQDSFKPKIPPSSSTVGGYKNKSKSKKMASKKTSMKVAKKTSSKAKENKNKKIVKSYSKSKSKKQSGGFIRGGVLFPQDFYDTSTVM